MTRRTEKVDKGLENTIAASEHDKHMGKSKTDYRLVKVTWQDSRHPYNGWQWVHDMKEIEPTICESVGWLIKDEPRVMILAASITIDSDGDAQISGAVDIPKRSIDEIVDLTHECSQA